MSHLFWEWKSQVAKYKAGIAFKRLLYFIQTHNPQRGKIQLRGQLEDLIWFDIQWQIRRKLCSRAALYLPAISLFGSQSRRRPVAHVSPHDTQSSSAKLTRSSTAAWPSPMLLSKSTNASTAPACPVPCPRPRLRQAPRPSPDHNCCSTALGTKLFGAGYFMSAALSKYFTEAYCSHETINKRR